MLTFALIPYNNIYALLALCLALAATAWALVEASVLRFMLISVILGFGFLLHSLTLLVMLPIGVLLTVLILPDWRRVALGVGCNRLRHDRRGCAPAVRLCPLASAAQSHPGAGEVAAHISLAAADCATSSPAPSLS